MKFYLNPIYHFAHTRCTRARPPFLKNVQLQQEKNHLPIFCQQSIINGGRLSIHKRSIRGKKSVCKMAIWSEKLICSSHFARLPFRKKGGLNPLFWSQRSLQKIFTWAGVKKDATKRYPSSTFDQSAENNFHLVNQAFSSSNGTRKNVQFSKSPTSGNEYFRVKKKMSNLTITSKLFRRKKNLLPSGNYELRVEKKHKHPVKQKGLKTYDTRSDVGFVCSVYFGRQWHVNCRGSCKSHRRSRRPDHLS